MGAEERIQEIGQEQRVPSLTLKSRSRVQKSMSTSTVVALEYMLSMVLKSSSH